MITFNPVAFIFVNRFKICFASFSILDFDSDNIETEFGKFCFRFFTLARQISPSCMVNLCFVLRGGITAGPAVHPLVFIVLPVGRDGHVRHGAVQQDLEQDVAGEVRDTDTAEKLCRYSG